MRVYVCTRARIYVYVCRRVYLTPTIWSTRFLPKNFRLKARSTATIWNFAKGLVDVDAVGVGGRTGIDGFSMEDGTRSRALLFFFFFFLLFLSVESGEWHSVVVGRARFSYHSTIQHPSISVLAWISAENDSFHFQGRRFLLDVSNVSTDGRKGR